MGTGVGTGSRFKQGWRPEPAARVFRWGRRSDPRWRFETLLVWGLCLSPPRPEDVDLQIWRADLLQQRYRKWLKAGFNNSIFPPVIPASSLLCSAKGQILTDFATKKQQWGHLRDYSTVFGSVCGLRSHYLTKSAETSKGSLMKLLESINRTFSRADEISSVTFGGFLLKQSHVWQSDVLPIMETTSRIRLRPPTSIMLTEREKTSN